MFWKTDCWHTVDAQTRTASSSDHDITKTNLSSSQTEQLQLKYIES